MKMNTQRNVMKCIGATLAVCSAIAMVGGTKSCSAKKTIKKTVNKMADIVDSVTAFMYQKIPLATNQRDFRFI